MPNWRSRLGREPNAMETMGAGTSPTRSSPPRVAGTPGRPRAGWAEKEDSGGSDDDHECPAGLEARSSDDMRKYIGVELNLCPPA